MGMPCDCRCDDERYNVRKIRIADGKTIWRKYLSYDDDGTLLEQGLDCAFLRGGCCEDDRLVVGVGRATNYEGGVPFGLSATTGSTLWSRPSHRLRRTDISSTIIPWSDGYDAFNQIVQDIDSNPSGRWISSFVPTDPANSDLSEIAVHTANGSRLWSQLQEQKLSGGKFGDDAFFAFNNALSFDISPPDQRLTSGASETGYLSYRKYNVITSPDIGSITKVFGVRENIAIVEAAYLIANDTVINSLTHIFYDLTAGDAVTDTEFTQVALNGSLHGDTHIFDAHWHRRNGVVEMFANARCDGLVVDYRTGEPLDGKCGLVKSTHNVTGVSLLETTVPPCRLWLCPDGVVAVAGRTGFTIQGQSHDVEILKCDFDLNLQWVARWTNGSDYGRHITGISGDEEYIYVSGYPSYWRDDKDV